MLPAYFFLKLEITLHLNLNINKFLSVQSSQVTDNSANKAEEKVTEARYSTHSLEEVAAMIRKTISVYEAKVVVFYYFFID